MTAPIILASASPRRSALLAALGLKFNVITSNAEETLDGNSPQDIVQTNARIKRDDVAARVEGPAIVIAADTLVFFDGHAVAKPPTAQEAHTMLQRLSANTHEVITGLAIKNTHTGKSVEDFERTAVTFRTLTEQEIDRFVDVVQPMDRAGAYTVDGPGSLLVAHYDGCYQNVLGLPIVKLDQLLREFDITLFDHLDKKRATFL